MTDQIRTALDWEDVRIFVALARYGSLSAAARALSVTHATISRRIQALEQTLGEKLVERRPEGYVLTPAGTHALGPANDMEAAAAKLIRGGPDDMPKGLVRINAPPSLTQSFLVTRLAQLAMDYPSLDINTTTDFRNVSLELHETDIALRFGRPEDGDVIAKFVMSIGFGFYATDEWCRRIKQGAAPEFVGFDESNAHLPEAVWLSQRFPRARISFRANLQLAQADAAKVGAGIAMLPHFIGRADSTLIPCPLEHNPPARELWLITRRQDRRDLSIRTVTEFITQVVTNERALFE
ncbi:LysR family transcriptional regulator [Undibacterium sp.]|uniref:LysR family transcriptional regulator n=1 Tax=Undibacterium sp. TaxID=1914977 RepID=UPI00374DBBE3